MRTFPDSSSLAWVCVELSFDAPHWPTLLMVMVIGSAIALGAFAVDAGIGKFVERVRAGAGPWRAVVLRLAPIVRLCLGAATALALLVMAFRLPIGVALILGMVLVLALGLATVDMLRNILAGIVIGVRRAYAVGDRIRVHEHEGEVRHLGMRATTLRKPDGTIIILPNRLLVTSIIENVGSEGRGAPVRVLVPLPPDMDLAAAKSLAFRAACVSKYVSVTDRPDVYVVHGAAGSNTLQLEVYVRAFDGRFADHLRSEVLELMDEGLRQQTPASTPTPS